MYAAARKLSDLDPLLARHGAKLVPLTLDVTQTEQVEAAAARAADVQLLINNAGLAAHAGGSFTDRKWIEAGRHEMEVNYLGTLSVSQAFAPVLARNGGGAIANVASVASFVNFPVIAAYSASKAAMHSITQATRLMLKAQNTRVFGIYPGPIDTRMTAGITMEKTSRQDAARAIVEGIQSGTEEIFPDPMSRKLGAAYLSNPKGLESQVATTPT